MFERRFRSAYSSKLYALGAADCLSTSDRRGSGRRKAAMIRLGGTSCWCSSPLWVEYIEMLLALEALCARGGILSPPVCDGRSVGWSVSEYSGEGVRAAGGGVTARRASGGGEAERRARGLERTGACSSSPRAPSPENFMVGASAVRSTV